MDGKESHNYSFYSANIILPQVTRLNYGCRPAIATISANSSRSDPLPVHNGALMDPLISAHALSSRKSNFCVPESSSHLSSPEFNFFVPKPPALPRSETRSSHRSCSSASLSSCGSDANAPSSTPHKRLSPISTSPCTGKLKGFAKGSPNKSRTRTNNGSSNSVEQPDSQESLPEAGVSPKLCEKDIGREVYHEDNALIASYQNFLTAQYGKELGVGNSEHSSSESDYSVSSVSDSSSDASPDEITVDSDTLKKQEGSLEHCYSLPCKGRTLRSVDHHCKDSVNKAAFTAPKFNLRGRWDEDGYMMPVMRSGSLPNLRTSGAGATCNSSYRQKVESEAESEPGTRLPYKVRPLPPILVNCPFESVHLQPQSGTYKNSSGLYETIDHHAIQGKSDSDKRASFRAIANFLTLVPRLTTNSVRSRKQDHALSDISQYLPDRKLTIFVGTWNMKGTRMLPDSLDDFLLPSDSTYLQDVYVVGTQEGTPFRREWQVRLQEAFGPSHVLMQSSNFGVLQLSVFVRRELVWFCTAVEQDTTATRMGHKIKTKGALAMCFSVFGTSMLFITSHFASHEGKLRDRINDYNAIRKNIQLPYLNSIGDKDDVTTRFDRVFWFGDFNFRVKKPRDQVDRFMEKHSSDRTFVIAELLQHDQLLETYRRGKIFHGFQEAPITFMPTYKFDVNSSNYDTSAKRRVPSWTDRILHKSDPPNQLTVLCYASCESVRNSDHRPVYAIYETSIEPYKSKFAIPTPSFDRDVYIEANLRRAAPSGSQQNSHICTIL